MSYELLFEGMSPDEESKDQMLLACRRLVVAMDSHSEIHFTLKQIDGRAQCRIEVAVARRRLSITVWRVEPMEAIEAAVDAALEAVFGDNRAFFSMPEFRIHLALQPVPR